MTEGQAQACILPVGNVGIMLCEITAQLLTAHAGKDWALADAKSVNNNITQAENRTPSRRIRILLQYCTADAEFKCNQACGRKAEMISGEKEICE